VFVYQAGMNMHQQLVADIEAFCKANEISGAKFGELSVGDASFWWKVSRGRQPTLSTYEKVRNFMDGYKL